MSAPQLTSRTKSKDTGASPVYFSALMVENFRCFGPRQSLTLTDSRGRPARWTIILGENGVGKTTLLQSIAMMEPVSLVPIHARASDSVVGFLPRRATLAHSAWDENNRLDNGSKYTISAFYSVNHRFTQRGEVSEPVFSVLSGLGSTFGAGAVANQENLSGFVCYGYGASRRMGKTALSDRAASDGTASLFADNVDLINAEEWLLQTDYAAAIQINKTDTARQHYETVKQTLLQLLPDVEDMRPSVYQGTPFVEVKTPYGWVPIQSLSLGYKAMIAWIVDLANGLFTRYPKSANPLAEPAIVLIDELDLHLHPRWQRNIISYLIELFPNTQFIATAHSPLVVQAAIDANVVVLRREGDHVVIDNNPAMVRNWRVDQILTSDLFGLDSARPPQLDNLLKEREEILTKGKLTKRDENRLKTLAKQIGELPTGESAADIEAMDIIRRAAAALQQE